MHRIIARDPGVDESWDGLRFAAVVTERQVCAIATRLHSPLLIDQVAATVQALRFRRGRSAREEVVRDWLQNAWNTEHILASTRILAESDPTCSVLHWAFPQCYYAVYSATAAFFNLSGCTESSHAAVIRKFSTFILDGRYPELLSVAATGSHQPFELHGIVLPAGASRIRFNPEDPDTVDTHICQLLRSTRRQSLEEKRSEMKFFTRDGRPKRRLNQQDWERVANSVGATTILSYLYRKRIKSNYRNIATFTSGQIDTETTLGALCRVTASVNFVHESFIASLMGFDQYQALVTDFSRDRRVEFLTKRCAAVRLVV